MPGQSTGLVPKSKGSGELSHDSNGEIWAALQKIGSSWERQRGMPGKETGVARTSAECCRGCGHRVEDSRGKCGGGCGEDGQGLGLTADYCVSSR